ncbi:MAG: diaminopimelate epimerase [Candidatus Omnitrophica bacterium]|nr:diaminopimelate epimerase [Candidatus Omnitrophota bacterium]
MRRIDFVKTVASGNDFVLIRHSSVLSKINPQSLAKILCNRKFGIGADGLLLLGDSKKADVRMRIFNPDGSEAQMCGNGARCVAFYLAHRTKGKGKFSMETKAGIIKSEVFKDNVKIKLTLPVDIRLKQPLKIAGRILKINFIDTGVPHTVVFVEGLDKIDVLGLGRFIRYHRRFSPQGTNVDFVEPLDNSVISIRTYERGVEDETLACGTGAVASALIFAVSWPRSSSSKIEVLTKSNEKLKVYFKRDKDRFEDVWLEGKARIVFEGRLNL